MRSHERIADLFAESVGCYGIALRMLFPFDEERDVFWPEPGYLAADCGPVSYTHLTLPTKA